MGTITTLVTVQEFLALPEPQGERIELIWGEVIGMPRAGQRHEITKSNLLMMLAAWSVQNRKGRSSPKPLSSLMSITLQSRM